MSDQSVRVAVVGATGYTGRLVVDELNGRGQQVVAVGRSREKLEALEAGVERRIADARDADAVREAIADCRVVVSCVGPFVDLGEPTLRAAVAAGVHYIDTTGEQAFMRLVFEGYDAPARDAGIACVPAVGFDYVPGDMAAALAARRLGVPPERIDVHYLIRKAKASDGTKRTGMRVAELPCLAWEDGRLVERRIGENPRRFAFPDGEANVALWPGGEVLTVPRHTGARHVAVYMRMPKAMSTVARGAGHAGPLLRAGRAAVGGGTGGPNEQDRVRGFYEIVAVARSADERASCMVRGHDMYGMTAAACAEAVVRLGTGAPERIGALAPSEAFDPEGFLEALSDYLTPRSDGPERL